MVGAKHYTAMLAKDKRHIKLKEWAVCSLGTKCERLGDKYKHTFEVFEWLSVAIFSVEYILRCVFCFCRRWYESVDCESVLVLRHPHCTAFGLWAQE
jgi:hypothetical protein